MKAIYEEILKRLSEGRGSELISRYSPQGIERRLLDVSGDIEAEDGLRFLEGAEGYTLTERFYPKPRLIILGGGHIALPLAQIAGMLEFDIWVYDDRPHFANTARFPAARRVICDDFANIGERLDFRRGDYVSILTRGHRHDIFCLKTLLQEGERPHYVGMIGSKRRIQIVKEQVAAELGGMDELDRLYAPIGLPIGSVTPEEIALSIVAEIVRIKRLGPEGKGKKAAGEAGFDPAVLNWLAAPREGGAALATIVSTRGSTPREAGAKLALTARGEVLGSIGGGCVEAAVLLKARDVMDRGGYLLHEADLSDSAEEDGMVCGGVMQVLIEAV